MGGSGAVLLDLRRTGRRPPEAIHFICGRRNAERQDTQVPVKQFDAAVMKTVREDTLGQFTGPCRACSLNDVERGDGIAVVHHVDLELSQRRLPPPAWDSQRFKRAPLWA